MDVIALYTRLHPGMEGDYEAFHREVPSEIVEDLVARGVHDWRIWRRGQDQRIGRREHYEGGVVTSGPAVA
jgi:L-rhamnose mutarotase